MNARDRFTTTESAQLGARGVLVAGATVPLWAASIDYFVTPRQQWAESLSAIRALGFRAIDVRVPWNVHEVQEDEYDFGTQNPQLALREFLELVHEHRLFASVRPGPRQLQAPDLRTSGLPARVLWDERFVAHTPKGNPLVLPKLLGSHPEPSLHSAAYLEACSHWLSTATVQLAPLLYPKGPVVLLELGSERVSRLTERTWGDFRPEALAAYRVFLKNKYERPSALREQHGDLSLDFANVLPPKTPLALDDTPEAAYLDWADFQRLTFGKRLAEFAAIARDAGLEDVALSAPIDIPWGQARQTAPRADTRLDDTTSLRDVSMLNLRAEVAGLVGIGTLHVSHSIDCRGPGQDELWFQNLRALAYGLRAFSVSGATARPRHIGGLLDEEASPTELGERWAGLLEALDRVQFHSLERVVSAQIVLPRRLSATALVANALRPLTAGSLRIEEMVPGALSSAQVTDSDSRRCAEAERFVCALATCLRQHRVPFRFVADDHVDAAVNSDYWTIIPSLPELQPELAESIEFGQRRGAPLTLGPQLPPRWSPNETSAELPAVLSGDPDELNTWVSKLIASGKLTRDVAEPREVETTFFRASESGHLALAFVINPTKRGVSAQIACPGTDAKDALDQTRVHSFAERLEIAVPARSVRVLELSATR